MRSPSAAAMLPFLVVVCMSAASCAGAVGRVTASSIEQPVSFTPSVFDSGGAVYTAAPGYVLKHVTMSRGHWTMLWRNVDLSDATWDLSEQLSSEIRSCGGDAVVNLTVFVESDWWWYFSSLLPIIPDRVAVRVECDVVRLPGSSGSQ